MRTLAETLERLHEATTMGSGRDVRSAAGALESAANSSQNRGELVRYWAALSKQSARLGATSCLEDAALVLGRVAQTCGDCHRATRTRVIIESAPYPTQVTMQQHSWSMTQLRRGLMIPSDQDWLDGSLRILRGSFDRWAVTDNGDEAAVSRRLRELGEEAYDATKSGNRARLYGLMMAECVACHSDARDRTGQTATRNGCTPLP